MKYIKNTKEYLKERTIAYQLNSIKHDLVYRV